MLIALSLVAVCFVVIAILCVAQLSYKRGATDTKTKFIKNANEIEVYRAYTHIPKWASEICDYALGSSNWRVAVHYGNNGEKIVKLIDSDGQFYFELTFENDTKYWSFIFDEKSLNNSSVFSDCLRHVNFSHPIIFHLNKLGFNQRTTYISNKLAE